jgi:hypothetical protein
MPKSTNQPADPNEATRTTDPSPHDAFGIRQSNPTVAGQAEPHSKQMGQGVNPSAPEDANTTPGSTPKK